MHITAYIYIYSNATDRLKLIREQSVVLECKIQSFCIR